MVVPCCQTVRVHEPGKVEVKFLTGRVYIVLRVTTEPKEEMAESRRERQGGCTEQAGLTFGREIICMHWDWTDFPSSKLRRSFPVDPLISDVSSGVPR